MKKIIILVAAMCVAFSFCLMGCGNNYENAVKKEFVTDATVNGVAMKSSLESQTGDTVSVISPKESEVSVTTISEGEEYEAEGDVEFTSSFSGSTSIHYVGKYRINDDGEAENISWRAE